MLTADGCQDVAIPDETGCCPSPLCGNDLCCTFVIFFNLLPSGPLWDYWKQAAISYFERNPEKPEECPLLDDPRCPSLVLHAIYSVLKLREMVHGALWTAWRESNPYTAVTTLDYQLARLQWEDCYHQHCRSAVLGDGLTPYEIWSECGPLYCPPNFPPELENAVKRGIAIALSRANMGVIKNLCGINWIIAPLGAEITPIYPPGGAPKPPVYPPANSDMCNPDDYDQVCTGMQWQLSPTCDWIPGVGSGDVCEANSPPPQIPAFWDRGCDTPAGLPQQVWPGVLAAECIVRSMIPPSCPNNIFRVCTVTGEC